MRMRKTRITGIIMLIAALVFVVYALGHPEGSFPCSGNVTRTIYAVYVILMILLILSPFGRKKSPKKQSGR